MKNDEMYEAFLTSVKDIVEAELIIAMMKSEGIPAVRKHNIGGDYLEVFGNMTPFGINIFVPPTELERAKEILESRSEELMEEEGTDDDVMSIYEEAAKKKKNAGKWIVRIFLIVAALGIIFTPIYNYMTNR